MGFGIARASVVLVDLDNTLYDWLAFFGPAIRGLCTRLSELSGRPLKTIYTDFKDVFARHGSVEYTFALQELASLRGMHPDLSRSDIVKTYFDAVEVYQSRRRHFLRLYPDVPDGLIELRKLGVKIFAVSDAHRFHVVNRLRQLRIANLLDGVCCVADHADEEPSELAKIRRFDSARYTTGVERELILPRGLRKPSRGVLEWIIGELDLAPEAAVYVGDSLVKDIPMAQEAGVYDCWAAYGTEYSPVDMWTLVRVTNWPSDAVSKALNATPEGLGVRPSCTARSFRDIVGLVATPRHKWPPQAKPGIREQLPLFELGAESVAHR